ncbi:MAG: penicillin-binding protein activator LpoB [Limisphaerales bacterium]
MKPVQILSVTLLAFLLAGCATSGVQNPKGVGVTELRPDEKGFVTSTGIESQDIVTVADKMARGIVGLPQIVSATVPPRMVLDPVINETRFAINKDIFLTRMMTQLTAKSQGKVIFLARERMDALNREREMKRTGQVTATSDPNVQEFKGADFFLTGKLQGLSTRTSQGTSDYVLYTFQVIDARTSEIVWAGDHEIKRQGLEDAVYR